MSSYFDELNREVRTLSSFTKEDEPAFLNSLIKIESHLKDDCLQLANDKETPEEVKQKILDTIKKYEIRYAGGNFLGDEKGPSDGANMAVACRKSLLVDEMHSLFHTIASMRIKTRYGLIIDNPASTVRCRNLHDAEEKSNS